jgi:DNA-binding IclR family transcriptional regulator
MSSAQEMRLIEILVTHNQPVLSEDLACALGITRGEVHALAIRLQSLGYTAVDDATDTVAATSLADAALRGGLDPPDQ